MPKGSIMRDDNFIPVQNNEAIIVKKSVTLTGDANTNGDFDGTGNPSTLFTVTGDVLVNVFGIVNTNVAGAGATLEVGIAGGTALLIAQTTGTDLDDGHVWVDATPGVVQPVGSTNILNDGTDIILTVGTANATAGQIDFYCMYRPLEASASIVAA